MMNEMILKIEGLNCMHCKMAVEKALNGRLRWLFTRQGREPMRCGFD